MQAQQKMQEQEAREQVALRQVQAMRLRYWEYLFLTTIEMSEPELREALKYRSGDRRFAAAYVVGERLLEWPDDLIPLLEDRTAAVRQAARRSLIISSFLARNPEEARKRTPRARRFARGFIRGRPPGSTPAETRGLFHPGLGARRATGIKPRASLRAGG
jgi:hypothetical protein